MTVSITLIGGPTALIEIDGFRLLNLTMDTNDTIETARAFGDAVIVPVHTDGWAHFRQNANDLRVSFDALGFGKRLKLLEPGVRTEIEPLALASS